MSIISFCRVLISLLSPPSMSNSLRSFSGSFAKFSLVSLNLLIFTVHLRDLAGAGISTTIAAPLCRRLWIINGQSGYGGNFNVTRQRVRTRA